MPELKLRYPIGKFSSKENYDAEEIKSLILSIESLPKKLESIYPTFTPDLLNTSYRPDGWTARQLFHHLADSHMNAYIRFKWTITEDKPLIKAYDEKAWAETPDTKLDPALSIELLKALHAKWVLLLRAFKQEDLTRSFLHPESNQFVPLDRMIALYAWHGEHHLAHLQLIINGKSS